MRGIYLCAPYRLLIKLFNLSINSMLYYTSLLFINDLTHYSLEILSSILFFDIIFD